MGIGFAGDLTGVAVPRLNLEDSARIYHDNRFRIRVKVEYVMLF